MQAAQLRTRICFFGEPIDEHYEPRPGRGADRCLKEPRTGKMNELVSSWLGFPEPLLDP